MLLAGHCSLDDHTPGVLPVGFRQPSPNGLLQTTDSLEGSNGVVANNKLMISSNQITSVINV